MPVYLFAYSQANNPNTKLAIWSFIILHLLVYPASNAYNSYFDKDEGPIGGIEKPLPVDINLYYLANCIDFFALILSFIFCGWAFGLAIILYILVSKAYSHPSIRLKKYPIISWLIVGLFQGAFIYLAVFGLITGNNFNGINLEILFPSLLTSLNLWAFYPITQIYQHDEDAKRGDYTLSLKLGIYGTFIFTGILFLISTFGFYFYFKSGLKLFSSEFLIYLFCLSPGLIFYNYWVFKSWKSKENVNFKNTMYMNILGSIGLNIFFFVLIYLKK